MCSRLRREKQRGSEPALFRSSGLAHPSAWRWPAKRPSSFRDRCTRIGGSYCRRPGKNRRRGCTLVESPVCATGCRNVCGRDGARVRFVTAVLPNAAEQPLPCARTSMSFRKSLARSSLPRESLARQYAVTASAVRLLGRETAIAFLNADNANLGGRPLDLAVSSTEGAERVTGEMERLVASCVDRRTRAEEN